MSYSQFFMLSVIVVYVLIFIFFRDFYGLCGFYYAFYYM